MLTLPSSVRIYVAAEAVDLRRGFDGLAAATRSVIHEDPLEESRANFPEWNILDGDAADVSGAPGLVWKAEPRFYRLRRE